MEAFLGLEKKREKHRGHWAEGARGRKVTWKERVLKKRQRTALLVAPQPLKTMRNGKDG